MRQDRHIYLDHAATSPLRPGVWRAMDEALGEADFNAASAHAPGRAAGARLSEARGTLAEVLGVPRERIVFTGGGTQSDNLAVLGWARAARARLGADASPRIILSSVEHKAVKQAAARAAREGAEVHHVPVDASGVVDVSWLEERLPEGADRPTLVSVMWANNEIGTGQPVAEITRLAHAHGAVVHTDAVQAFGKLDVSAEADGVDLLTATAHKLGGPVGIGLLYVSGDVELEPLVFGGTQERGMWPGTQNPVAALGFARAAELALDEREETWTRWRRMRGDLEERLRAAVPGLRIRGEGASVRLPNILNVAVPGVDQNALLVNLDMEGVALSSGSACASGAVEPSHVLEALGEPGPDEVATLRLSFGPDTSPEDVDRAADAVIRVVDRLGAGRRVG